MNKEIQEAKIEAIQHSDLLVAELKSEVEFLKNWVVQLDKKVNNK